MIDSGRAVPVSLYALMIGATAACGASTAPTENSSPVAATLPTAAQAPAAAAGAAQLPATPATQPSPISAGTSASGTCLT
ncbi:MAG: hypothetical protein JNL54_15105 [Kineosporiaceae bacterium]|nr:hypothetical protein [Kineosporiaceae bacterium]